MSYKTNSLKNKRNFFNKKVRRKRKNYMYMHYDEVHMQKIYSANWPFYLKLILIPSVLILSVVIIFAICEVLTQFLVSIILGILGSYIASVVVTWLVDIKTCESKTFERMRFQHVYFANLIDICSGFAFFYVSYLAKNFSEEAQKRLSDAEKNMKYYKGDPWQYWRCLLDDIIQNKYPFDVQDDDETSFEWISCNPKNYTGEKFVTVKGKIEKETKIYFSSYFENSDFLNRVISSIASYRSSLSNVYVNDYIYNQQLQILNALLNRMEDFVKCVENKKYIDFWHINHSILMLINTLSVELYPFKCLRENEHICKLNYKDNGDVYVHFDTLNEFVVDDDDPVYTLFRRKEYRKNKKQNRINERFESENQFTFDNGWL